MKLSDRYKKKIDNINEKIGTYTTDNDKKEEEESGNVFGLGILDTSNFAGLSLLTWAEIAAGAIIGWRGKKWWNKVRGNKDEAQAVGFWTKNGLNPIALISKWYRDPKALRQFKTKFGLSDKDIQELLNNCSVAITEKTQADIYGWYNQIEMGQLSPKGFLSAVLRLVPRGPKRREIFNEVAARYDISKEIAGTGIKNVEKKILQQGEYPSIYTGTSSGDIHFKRITNDEWDKLNTNIRNKLIQKVKDKELTAFDVTFENAKDLAYPEVAASAKAAANAERVAALEKQGITFSNK